MKKTLIFFCVLFAIPCNSQNSRVNYTLRCSLPELPDSGIKAGNIELRIKESAKKIEIPEFEKEIFKNETIFFKNKKVNTKTKNVSWKQACDMVDTIIENYFAPVTPNLILYEKIKSMESYNILGVIPKSRLGFGGFFYKQTFNSIPVFNDKLYIKYEKGYIEKVNVRLHDFKEISEKKSLVEANVCLDKLVDMETAWGDIIVTEAKLFYIGNLSKLFIEKDKPYPESFHAYPSYLFCLIYNMEGKIWRYYMDARNCELLHSTEAD
jgi:hypothetical protein